MDIKRIINGFAAGILILAGFAAIVQSAVPVYAQTESSANNESGSASNDAAATDENAVPSDEEQATQANEAAVSEPAAKAQAAPQLLAAGPAIITAKTDVTYQAGSSVSTDQFIIDAEINIPNVLGVNVNPLVSLGTVDFGTPGTYTVTAVALSLLGIQLASVDINVHIIDTIKPVISGDANVGYQLGASVSAAQFLSDSHIKVTDNASAPVAPTVDLSGVNFAVAGTYTAVVHATDASGNAANAFNVTVTVGDTVAPVITADASITYYSGVSRNATQFIADTHVTVTDNSGETIVPGVNLSAVNFNTVGTYTATITAVDNSGNAAVPRTVTVNIVAAPNSLISAAVDVYFEAGPDRSQAEVIAAANINVATAVGLSSQPLVDLGGVNFSEVGVYPVSVAAVNLLGIPVVSESINVHIVDTTSPVISGTTPLTYQVGTTLTEAEFLAAANITVSDNTDEIIQAHASAINLFTVGSFDYQVYAQDSSGNVAVPFTVTINVVAAGTDITPPVITGDSAVSFEAGSVVDEAQFLSAAHIVVTDDSGATITPTVDLSGVDFGTPGTYNVIVTATDLAGNTTQFPITVTITDTTVPVVNIGANPISYEFGSNPSDSDIIAKAAITATDNGSVAPAILVDTTGVNFNMLGAQTATVRAVDGSGNVSAVLQLTINIVDTTNPVISGDTTITYPTGTVRTLANLIADAHLAVSDNSGEALTLLADLSGIDFNVAATHNLTISAQDSSGNVVQFPFVLVLADDVTPPTITVNNQDLTYEVGTSVSDNQIILDASIIVNDDLSTTNYSIDTSAIDFFSVGDYIAVFTATDTSGNSSTADINVHITDTTAPLLTVANTDLTYEVGTPVLEGQVLVDAGVSVTDNSGENILPQIDTSAVNYNQIGTYTAEITAVDTSGNQAVAVSVIIHVTDTTAPVITGISPVNFPIGTIPTHEEVISKANIVVTDNSGETITPQVNTGSVNFYSLGSYTATITATDSSGNTGNYQLQINVVDDIAPVLTITTAALTYEVGTTVGEAQVITDGGISATDNHDTNVDLQVNLSTVNFNLVGSYSAVVTAVDDSGNSSTGTLTINVTDTTKPVITGNPSVAFGLNASVDATQFIHDANIVVTDNSGELITPTVDLSQVDFSAKGIYQATVTATDSSNNVATMTVTVVIADFVGPVISVTTPELTYEVGTPVAASQIITDAGITVSDDSSETITPAIDLTGVNFMAVGTYTATVSAVDSAQNEANEQTLTIQIVDTTQPVISGNAVSYPINSSVSNAQFIIDANIAVTDNSGETLTPSVDLSGVNFNKAGTYNAVVTATDANNNTTDYTIVVTITDDIAPIIAITTNELTYEVGTPVSAAQIIIDGGIVVTDNSGELIIPTLDLSGVNFMLVGDYNVTVNAADSSGNAATEQTITIHITDTTMPEIDGKNQVVYQAGSTVNETQFITDAEIVVTDNSGEAISPTVDLSNIDFNTPGTYNATVSAVDSSNNTATFQVVVSVIDTIAPIITINQPEVTYEVGSTVSNAQIITDAGITVTDAGDASITPVLDLTHVDFTAVGDYTVTVTATDSSSNEATAQTLTIHIVDTTGPVITAKNVSYEAGSNVTTTQFAIDAAITVTDNSGETVTPTIDLSAVDFSTVGNYNATITAVDSHNNSSTKTVVVTITDTTAPIITITTNELSYEVGATVSESQIISDGGITVTDNSGETITPAVDLSNVDFMTVGRYTATVRALDSSDNSAIEQTITINIIDTTAPVVTANAVSYEAGTTVTPQQFIIDSAVTVTDNSGETITPTVDLAPVDFNTPGSYTVMVIVTDSNNNMTSYPVEVTITDTTAPTIVINTATLTYEVGSAATPEQIISDGGISVTDNSDATITPTIDLSNVDFMAVGSYTATVTAADASGNAAAQATLTINVVDTTAPVVTANNISYEAGLAVSDSQFLTDVAATIADNSGETITPTVDLSTVDFNTVGTYNVTITAVDASNNTGTTTVTVTITDATIPVIAVTTAELTYEVGATVTPAQIITDGGIMVTDNTDEAITPVIDLSAVNFMAIGTYTATVNAADSSGNSATEQTLTIIIEDTTVPTIIASNISYQAGTTVTEAKFLTDTSTTITDNSGETLTPTVDLSGVDFETVGTYSATITATDSSNNTTTKTVTVTIIDTTIPVITVTTAELTYEVGTTVTATQIITDGGITVADNTSETIEPIIDLSTVDFMTIGDYTATVNASDEDGNNAVEQTLTIHVTDTTAPVITANTISYEAGSVVTENQFWSNADVQVTDNSGETIAPVIDLSAVDFNTVGANNVTITATDSSGNVGTKTVVLTIVDTTAPVINFDLTTMTYELGTPVSESQVITDNNITVTDNTDEVITPTVDLSAVDFNALGTYTVTVTATDASGNIATKTFDITITDTTPPTITGTSPITYEAGPAKTSTQVILDAHITVSDNSNEFDSPHANLTNVQFDTVGTYTADISTLDPSGNEGLFELTIIIVDTTAPTITIANNDLTYEVGTTVSAAQMSTDAAITITENSSDIVTPVLDLSGVNFNQVGDYNVPVSATDSQGNTGTAAITVHITDTTAPIITANPVSYEVTSTISGTQVLADANVAVTDNSGASITPTIDLSTVDFNTVGSYTATITATDASDNTATYPLTVTIVDTTAPIITVANSPITYEVGSSIAAQQIITDGGITVTDNSGETITPVIDLATVNFNQIGTYTATVTAADTTGNAAIPQTITINIADTSKPTITGDNTITYEAGSTVTPAQFITDTNITVSDASGETIAPNADLSGVDFATPGTYTAAVTATDSSGNTTTFEVTVTIADTTIPVINITGSDVTYELGSTVTDAQIISDAGINVSDNATGTITPQLDTSTVDFNTVGDYSVTVTATDATGNAAAPATITIHIVDTIAPVITADAELDAELDQPMSEAEVITAAHISATDASGSVTITVDLSMVNFNQLGVYNATIHAVDINGNEATQSLEVRVDDTTGPELTLDRVIVYELGTTVTEEQFLEDINAEATDDSGIQSITANLAGLTRTIVGSYQVIVTATDNDGLSTSKVVLAVIRDTTAPELTADAELTVTVGTTMSDTDFVTATHAVATDLSGTPELTVDFSQVQAPAINAISIFALTGATTTFDSVGTYPVTITATDSSDNQSTAVVNVNVIADSTNNNGGGTGTNTNGNTDNTNGQLPNTGTNNAEMLLAGIILVSGGTIVALNVLGLKRKKQVLNMLTYNKKTEP